MKKLIFAVFALAMVFSIIFLAERSRAPDTARAVDKSRPMADLASTRDLAIPIGEISPSKQWIAPAVGSMLLNIERPRFEPLEELAGYARAPRHRPRNKDPYQRFAA